jgi:hypothetical protein
MQLRCTYCQTMFAISRDDMLAALEHMEENKLIYHDAHCPKCRRANRVERLRMERFFPDWKQAIRSMAKEAEAAGASAPAAKAAPKPAPVKASSAGKTTGKVSKPAAKPAAKASPKKPAASAARKPAAKAKAPVTRKK